MKPLLIWLIVAQGSDITSTQIARARGCQEGNPFAKDHLGTAFVVKSGATLGFSITLPILHRTKPRLAKSLAAALASVGTAAAVWNTGEILRHCR